MMPYLILACYVLLAFLCGSSGQAQSAFQFKGSDYRFVTYEGIRDESITYTGCLSGGCTNVAFLASVKNCETPGFFTREYFIAPSQGSQRSFLNTEIGLYFKTKIEGTKVRIDPILNAKFSDERQKCKTFLSSKGLTGTAPIFMVYGNASRAKGGRIMPIAIGKNARVAEKYNKRARVIVDAIFFADQVAK